MFRNITIVCGSPLLHPLHVLRLVLVRRWRRKLLLVGHQAGLLLGERSLVVGSLVVARARKTAAVVRGEERLATDELAPQPHQHGADEHAEDRDANAGNDTDQDGQNDVRGELAEEQGPAVLAVVVGHVAGLVPVVVVMSVGVPVSRLPTHHARAAVRLHPLELGGDDCAPLADVGGALLLLVAHGIGRVLGGGLLNLGDEKLVVRRLDQVHADVGEAVDEDGADLDDLQVNDDQIYALIGRLGNGVDLQAKAELLLDDLGLVLVGPELVVTLEGLDAILGVLVVLVVVLVVLVGNLGGDEDVGEGVGVGVQLEAVDEEAVGVCDGEVEL